MEIRTGDWEDKWNTFAHLCHVMQVLSTRNFEQEFMRDDDDDTEKVHERSPESRSS